MQKDIEQVEETINKYTEMRKLILMVIISLVCININATEKCDTIKYTGVIENIVTDVTVTTTGKKTTKYYFLCNDFLIPTNKTTAEKYKLAKKYNAQCNLYAVISNKTKEIKRIITL